MSPDKVRHIFHYPPPKDLRNDGKSITPLLRRDGNGSITIPRDGNGSITMESGGKTQYFPPILLALYQYFAAMRDCSCLFITWHVILLIDLVTKLDLTYFHLQFVQIPSHKM